MATSDMFLKVQGVTGEAGDAAHKGEIELVAWSWALQSSPAPMAGTAHTGQRGMTELEVVKRVDQSSVALMTFLYLNKLTKAKLTVRKAGQTPLEYLAIELENARITSLKIESQDATLVERVRLGFSKVTVTYTPQDARGGPGGALIFAADAHVGE